MDGNAEWEAGCISVMLMVFRLIGDWMGWPHWYGGLWRARAGKEVGVGRCAPNCGYVREQICRRDSWLPRPLIKRPGGFTGSRTPFGAQACAGLDEVGREQHTDIARAAQLLLIHALRTQEHHARGDQQGAIESDWRLLDRKARRPQARHRLARMGSASCKPDDRTVR